MGAGTVPTGGTDPATARAAVLSEPTRRRVWEAVRDARRPVGVPDLAGACGVHPNTVRMHLARLRTVGLVRETVETDRHPGRPGYRYQLAGSDPVSEAKAYRRLAGLLAEAVRSRSSARAAGRAAGAAGATGLSGSDPLTALAQALAADGFVPEVGTSQGDQVEIILHACPFATAAAEDPATVCHLHLGLAEGAADAIGGLAIEGLRIEDPFRAGCRVQVRQVPQSVRRA